MGKKSNTTVAVIITVLVMLVIGLTVYIVIDKTTNKDEKTKSNEEKVTTTTKNNQEINTNNNQPTPETNEIPSENEIKNMIITWVKKQQNIVDVRVNKISLESNTKELKEMINEDPNNILVGAEIDAIKDGNGYSKDQGWLRLNLGCCHLTKNTNGQYEVKTCASGW